MKRGVTDILPATNFRGQLRVRGSFTGDTVDRYRWKRARRERQPPRTGDRVKHYKELHPLFRVSWWCFSPEGKQSAQQRRELHKVIPRRRLCKKKK